MKASGLSLSIAVIAFGASTIYLAVQLSEERARSDELAQASRALNARIAELEKARDQGRIAAGTFGGTSMAPGTMLAVPPPTPAANASDAKSTSDGKVRVAGLYTPHGEGFKKMMRAQTRASNRQIYADVGTHLGLTREETSKLIDLITEQQVSGIGISMEVTDEAERQRAMQQAMRESKAKIDEFLGPEKLKLLEEYQQSIPARMELDMLARQIEGSDVAPLTADQRKRLLAALLEERDRIPNPTMTADDVKNGFAKSFAWQDDYEARLAGRARSILTTEQFNTFDEYQQAQKEMREQMLEQRKLAGGSDAAFFINASPGAIVGETAVVTSSSTEEDPAKAP